jgi:ribosomal protein S18 acetylase RimI-like enzyme
VSYLLVEIRDATVVDIDQVLALNASLMQSHLQYDEYYQLNQHSHDVYTEYFQRFIESDNARVLVALDEEVIVGFITGKIERRPPVFAVTEKGEINSVFVKELFRRQGIGGQLLRRMFDWFKAHGAEYVELSVDVRNIVSVNAWKSLGFEPWQMLMKRKLVRSDSG